MAYGLRVNFEYYFIKQAQSFLNEADKITKQRNLIDKILDIKFPKVIRYKLIERLYPKLDELKTDHTVKCAMACLMISFAYEALLNYLYRISIDRTSENLGDIDIKKELKDLKYRDKIFNKSCEIYNINRSIFSSELHILETIYSSRNIVVHYKEARTYQGFSIEHPIDSQFTRDSAQKGLETLLLFTQKIQSNFNLKENDLDIFKLKHFLDR